VLEELRRFPPDHLVEPGVTAGDALAVMTATEIPDGVRYVPDQVYGHDGHDLTMHLFSREDPGERRPGVVLIHGGGFVEGFAEMLLRYAAHLAAAGYVTASIEYRLAGESPFPASLEDSKCAVRWMRAHADEIGLDAERLAVAGNSAGGYLAAMVGSTPGLHEGRGGSPEASSAVAAVVLWYPAIDIRPSITSELAGIAVAAYFGRTPGEDEAAAASPVTFAAAAPPTLTLTGAADPIILVDQLRDYHARLAAAGVPERLVEFAGLGHSFDYNLERWGDCFGEVQAWLERHLGR
jgi:acetyl esterase/lipase